MDRNDHPSQGPKCRELRSRIWTRLPVRGRPLAGKPVTSSQSAPPGRGCRFVVAGSQSVPPGSWLPVRGCRFAVGPSRSWLPVRGCRFPGHHGALKVTQHSDSSLVENSEPLPSQSQEPYFAFCSPSTKISARRTSPSPTPSPAGHRVPKIADMALNCRPPRHSECPPTAVTEIPPQIPAQRKTITREGQSKYNTKYVWINSVRGENRELGLELPVVPIYSSASI